MEHIITKQNQIKETNQIYFTWPIIKLSLLLKLYDG